MARRPIVGGNWKMNTTYTSAIDLAEAVTRQLGEETAVQVVLFPPFPNLQAVEQVIAGTPFDLGAQDLFWEDWGAYTGEVSAPMLLAVGCRWALVGHSERRHLLHESDEIVNRKAHSALRHGLNLILAVGETGEQRQAGQTNQVLERQLRGSLAGVDAAAMERVVIAYEPVWAIGTGHTATPEQACQAHAAVRTVLAALYGPDVAEAARVQYGGSVTPANAADLMAQPGVDGALVGGASLKAADFAAIVQAAARST